MLLRFAETVQPVPHHIDGMLELIRQVRWSHFLPLHYVQHIGRSRELLVRYLPTQDYQLLEGVSVRKHVEHLTDLFLEGTQGELVADCVQKLRMLVDHLNHGIHVGRQLTHVNVARYQVFRLLEEGRWGVFIWILGCLLVGKAEGLRLDGGCLHHCGGLGSYDFFLGC